MNRYKYVGKHSKIRTKSGAVVADSFTRIVHGERGDYVEFEKLRSVYYIPDSAVWRRNNPEVYYLEYRVNSDPSVYIYFQKRPVTYADYKERMFYISPKFLQDFEIEEK